LSKRTLIIVGIPDFDYSNKMSAVASFLKKVKDAFEKEGYEVVLGFSADHKVNTSLSTNNSGGVKGLLKSILKKWAWLYQSIAFSGFLKDRIN